MSSSPSSPSASPPSASSFELSKPFNAPIMPFNRVPGRNISIYDAKDPNKILGGLILTNGVTNANFHSMVEILIIFGGDFSLLDGAGTKIKRDNDPLQPGNYFIDADKPFSINDEPILTRAFSYQTGTRVQEFSDAVRQRDGRCVISGKRAIHAWKESWVGFEAAHIFPLAYEGHWKHSDYSRWITIPPQKESAGTINSVQNGLLLRCDLHKLFDAYYFSVNPDDNYKVVCFMEDGDGIAGKHLDQEFLDNPQRAVDQLLRWHFRQAVFTNMKGAGEPCFEDDFPSGSDMMGQILVGPKAAERMEFELFNRLGAQMETVSIET